MTKRVLSRRQLLEGLIAVPAAMVLVAACGSDDTSNTATAQGNTTEGTDPAGTPASTTGTATETSGGEATTTASGAWASGGTELITVAYPASTIFASANTCTVSLTNATTEGPCYFETDTEEDISQGKTGLPMQLCVQLVDDSCAPLEGYRIEAWSCDNRGIYSGETSASADATRFAGSFCTADDEEALTSTYLRGQATTDSEGRANFKTIFPGWYSGRTIHVHFAVSDADGTSRVISQWCFPDEFTEEICTTHDQYADRGVQDTPLSGGTDTVFPVDSYEEYLLSLEQNSDGTLLGYGVIQIDPTAVAAQSSAGGASAPPDGGGRP